MGFSLTSPAPKKCDPTAENRVWGFFGEAPKTSRENHPQSLQPRQGNRPSPTAIASGRTYWPSRDPIGERGGVNLYGVVGNDGVNYIDVLGLAQIVADLDYPLTGKPSLTDGKEGYNVNIHHKVKKGKGYIQVMFNSEYKKSCEGTEETSFSIVFDIWNTTKMRGLVQKNGAVYISDVYRNNGGTSIVRNVEKEGFELTYIEDLCAFTRTVHPMLYEVDLDDVEVFREKIGSMNNVENRPPSNMFRWDSGKSSSFSDPLNMYVTALSIKGPPIQSFVFKYSRDSTCEGELATFSSEKVEVSGDLTSEIPEIK